MGAEEVAFGVGANLIAAGLLRIENITRDALRDTFREAEFSAELDDVETIFIGELQNQVAEIDSQRDTGEIAGVVERWDSVVRELYGLEEAAEVDGVDQILFSSEQEAVEEISAAIARAAGFDIADTPQLETDLMAAVARAYRNAIEECPEVFGDSIAEQFLISSAIKLHDRLSDVQRKLDDLHRRFSRRAYDLHPGNEAGKQRVAEKVRQENPHSSENVRTEYVDRPELKDVADDESLLLLGPGGSGKTRSLVELVRSHEGIDHIVYPRSVFQNPEQASAFVTERFEGDVLLVWDDIHKANPEEDNTVVRRVVEELRDLLAPEHELHILATGRIKQKDQIPGDPDVDDGLWRGVTPVELAYLDIEPLVQLIQKAVDAYEVTVSDESRRAFLKKTLDSEPTPLFVTSVLENAGEELTEEDVEALPETAVEIWEKGYQRTAKEPRRALRSMKTLGELAPGSVFPKSLLRGVYSEVFDGPEADFDQPFQKVLNEYWLFEAEADGETTYGMHDVKQAAVEAESDEFLLDRLSTFLIESQEQYFRYVSPPTRRVIHGNLAKRAEDIEWAVNIARTHYNYILDHIDEEDEVTLFNLGVLLDEEGETDEAKRRYKEAIEADPDYAEAYSNLGVLLKQEGETDEAKRRFEQAIEADPDYAEAHANLGFTLLSGSEYAPAIKRFETSVRLWLNAGSIENVINDMGALTTALEGAEERSRAIECCVTALGIAANAGLSEDAVGWAWNYLSDNASEKPSVTVRCAGVETISGRLNVGYNLFYLLRETEREIDGEYARIADVAVAAFHRLSEAGDENAETILSDVDPDTLSDAAYAVYSYLQSGESDRRTSDEASTQEFAPYPFAADDHDRRIANISLDEIEQRLFDTLLRQLREET
ncbi:tetratricopeptide repeat protein [Halobellus ruber]|uniref:Tetratricopeptide repeat protein n=1 Tax=Halobellus ruber TaxID=2761102 RepID=A0A7J9SJE2_9EURY|nr:tetratricopeptide repeat protein [Halobellus ruber]MBB6646503.1 tetratricopeptide repeat protein [Halobellus ruber]